MRSEFPTADVVVADVGADSDVATLDAAIARAGQLNHVVAPLGAWWQRGPSIDEQPVELDGLLATYTSAQFRLLRTAAPHLRRTNGSYTLVTGAAGEMLLPGTGLLVVAVRAQYALADVLRQELAADPIRFNELRIAARIERTPRPGVIASETLGAVFVDIMTGDVRSELIRYPATPPL